MGNSRYSNLWAVCSVEGLDNCSVVCSVEGLDKMIVPTEQLTQTLSSYFGYTITYCNL